MQIFKAAPFVNMSLTSVHCFDIGVWSDTPCLWDMNPPRLLRGESISQRLRSKLVRLHQILILSFWSVCADRLSDRQTDTLTQIHWDASKNTTCSAQHV